MQPSSDTILPFNLSRLVHRDISRSQSSSGLNTRLWSTTVNQPNALNMARYRKAVNNALWVQLALVVCYVPQFIVKIVIFLSTKRFSNLFIFLGMANVLVFFNSTLNPFLYSLPIKAVMQTTSDYYRCSLRVNSEATFYDRGIETK